MDTLLSNAVGQAQRSAVGLSPLNVNMDQLLCNLSSAFNPLHRECLLNYQVTALSKDHVCMSVVMPNEMLQSFSQLLESMGGFFRVVNHKARAASAAIKTHDLDKIAERERITKAFQTEVCTLFDSFIKQGHDKNEAVKRTNNSLKAVNNPWATRHIIETVLRSEGRFRRPKAEINILGLEVCK